MNNKPTKTYRANHSRRNELPNTHGWQKQLQTIPAGSQITKQMKKKLRPELTCGRARGGWESEIRKDWTWREREEGEGGEFPCCELGFGDNGDWGEDDVDSWVCEGKMDMKFLEVKGRFVGDNSQSEFAITLPLISHFLTLPFYCHLHDPRGICLQNLPSPNILEITI